MNPPKGKISSGKVNADTKKFLKDLVQKELESVMQSKLGAMGMMDQISKEWDVGVDQKTRDRETSMPLKQKKILIAMEEMSKLAEDLAGRCRNMEEENKILKSEIENCKRKDEEMLKCWQNVDKRLKELSANLARIDRMNKNYEHNSKMSNEEINNAQMRSSLEERMTNLEESLHKALHVMLPRVDSVLSTLGSIPERDNSNVKINCLASIKEREKEEALKKVSETIGDSRPSEDSPKNVSPPLPSPCKPPFATTSSLKSTQKKNSVKDMINSSAPKNVTSLIKAIKNDNEDEVLDLLNSGLHVNTCNEDGFTGLHAAAEFGYIRITSLFLERGADVNVEDASGKTPIFNAASNRNVACISLLVNAGANVNARAKDGTTALHQAALSGDVETIRELIGDGAITSVADSEGWTPLHWAVVWGSVETAGALFEAGCDTSIPDKQDNTPLHTAVVSGRTDTAKLLLKAGVCLSEVNMGNMTPSELNTSEKIIKELRYILRNENVATLHHFPIPQNERNDGFKQVGRKKRGRKFLYD